MKAAVPGNGALAGLTVIDLTQMLAGPYASMMLSDQGARVIKIEPPGGDLTRTSSPVPKGSLPSEQGGFGAYFASINRGKESIVLDLKQEAAKEVFLKLVDQADVLIENFRAGVMERLGLGYEILSARNKRLVYGTLRGFGDRRSGLSPYSDWPAYDPVAQAMGGIMSITGSTPGGPPTKVGPGIGDIAPAMFLAYGVISACWQAKDSGQGQFVDVAMVDSILAICERLVFQYSATGISPGPEGNGHPLLCPFGLFPSNDGYVSIGVGRDEFWKILAERMGQPELGNDPRYATMVARVERRREVDGLVTTWTSARSMKEISAALGGHVPFGPVFGAREIFADPHFPSRKMLTEVEHPGLERPLTIVDTPIKMSRTSGGIRNRAPLLGEHTNSVLKELGYDDHTCKRLRQVGAIS